MATLDNLEEASTTSLPIIPRFFPSASDGVDGCEKDKDIFTQDKTSPICPTIIPWYSPSAFDSFDGCEKATDISTGDNFEEASDICRHSILFTTN